MESFLALGIFAALALVPLQVSAAPLDFQQALKLALSQSPDYDSAVRAQRSAELTTKNSRSVFYPQFNLEAQHLYTRSSSEAAEPVLTTSTGTLVTTTNSPWSNNLGLNISENLYDNGDSYRLLQVSEDSEEVAKLNRSKSQQQLLLTVSKAFYDYSVSVGTLDLQKQELELLRRQLRLIEGRYRQGMKSNRDFLQIKAQVQRSEISLDSAQINLEESLRTLRQAIGSAEQLEFIPFKPDTSELDRIEFPKISVEETLDVRIANLQNQISDLKYETVRRSDWPRVSLAGSYNYNVPQYLGPRDSGTVNYWNAQVALVIDYALLDWGIRSRNVAIADNQRQVEKNQEQDIRIQIAQDLRRYYSQTDLRVSSYVKSKQVLKDEQSVYNSLSAGYREGKVSYLELITALQDLFGTQIQHLGLQFDLLKTRDQLAYYRGNLDEVLHAR